MSVLLSMLLMLFPKIFTSFQEITQVASLLNQHHILKWMLNFQENLCMITTFGPFVH